MLKCDFRIVLRWRRRFLRSKKPADKKPGHVKIEDLKAEAQELTNKEKKKVKGGVLLLLHPVPFQSLIPTLRKTNDACSYVLYHGMPGVGKLTVARELATLTGFKLFDESYNSPPCRVSSRLRQQNRLSN